LAVYGHRHRERRPRPREERRGDGRAARATRSTADGDVAGVTHRAGRYERRVSARRASGAEARWFAEVVARKTFRVTTVGRSQSAVPDDFDRRGRSTSNRILQEKDLGMLCARFSRTAGVHNLGEPTGHLKGRELAFGATSPRAALQEGTHALHFSPSGSTSRRPSTLASGPPARNRPEL
jgi:hypothetical protein